MIKSQSFSTIGKASHLKGIFEFTGATQLLGTVTGEINLAANSPLIIDLGAYVEGVINCEHIEIYGEFKGDLNSTGKVILYPSAVVNGKIIAKNLEILPGAVVNINGHTQEN